MWVHAPFSRPFCLRNRRSLHFGKRGALGIGGKLPGVIRLGTEQDFPNRRWARFDFLGEGGGGSEFGWRVGGVAGGYRAQ